MPNNGRNKVKSSLMHRTKSAVATLIHSLAVAVQVCNHRKVLPLYLIFINLERNSKVFYLSTLKQNLSTRY